MLQQKVILNLGVLILEKVEKDTQSKILSLLIHVKLKIASKMACMSAYT